MALSLHPSRRSGVDRTSHGDKQLNRTRQGKPRVSEPRHGVLREGLYTIHGRCFKASGVWNGVIIALQ